MLTKTKILSSLFLVTALSFGAASSALAEEQCGKVTIADMNWTSAEFAAYLDKFILENGYGCEVELVAGDTMPTLTSMIEKGQPDIAPELWTNAAREVIAKAIEDKKLAKGGEILIDGGEEGWWIPQYVKDANPELKTVADVLKRPDLFPHPEEEGKGGFMTCPAGWSCQIVNQNLAKANKIEDANFLVVDPGSSAGLDGSIAKAYERKKPWFGYYWAPTAILGKYPMYKLDFAVEHDAEGWNSCIVKEECEDPKPSSWTKSEAFTITSAAFAQKHAEKNAALMEYLNKRQYKNDMLNGVLAWMTDNQATGEDGAEHFLKNHEDIWTKWVSEDVAKKIKAAL